MFAMPRKPKTPKPPAPAALAAPAAQEKLSKYRAMRPAGKSPEPRGGSSTLEGNSFVVQRHDATRLHYDVRLEMGGVLKSWAVPKGPSLDPSVKRLAVQTEDHPLDYGGFEGRIPEGQYGAGEVIVWDRGTYDVVGSVPAEEQVERGEIKFVLHGEKLNGGWVLVKLRKPGAQREWLMIKHKDAEVRTDWDIENHGESVKTGRPPGPPRHPGKLQPQQKARPSLAHPGKLTNARKAPMPDAIHPALATVSEIPSESADWFYEIKFDGIRVVIFIESGKVRLQARSGRDITREYPELAGMAKSVFARDAVLDGEIVVLDEKGHSDFQKLQSRFGVINPPPALQAEAPPTLYLFDALYCDGYDVRRAPLRERKNLLVQIVSVGNQIRISDHQEGQGRALFAAAVREGLEGIIGKRADGGYPEGRTNSWLKFKGVREIDGVIGGWTAPRGSREFFGALLVGLYDGEELKFVGGVGTGFDRETERDIFKKLEALETKRSPFSPVPRTKEEAHWVKPTLLARVGYAEWTSDRHLRQPRFLGLQPDRNPRESTFTKEKPSKKSRTHAAPAPVAASSPDSGEAGEFDSAVASAPTVVTAPRPKQPTRATKSSSRDLDSLLAAIRNKSNRELPLDLDGKTLKLTHLDKIYFPKDDVTKRDVLAHYAAASPYLLPFLADRPLVLHRYPNGIHAGAFYQKDSGSAIPDWIRTVKIYSETKKEDIPYFVADDLASLLYLTNLGCIEQNPFSARADDLETPDYMFVDLDPTDGTDFTRVVRAAVLLGKVLDEAKLTWFPKTSGATGLHIFIPLEPRYRFEQVRSLLEILTHLAVEREKNLLTRIFTVKDRPRGSVFVDVRQNAYAQSLASVLSLRPRDGAPVSTPLARTDLTPKLHPSQWNIRTIAKVLPARAKLWSSFFSKPQKLETAVAALEKRR